MLRFLVSLLTERPGDIETPASVCVHHVPFSHKFEDPLLYFTKSSRYVHHAMCVCCIYIFYINQIFLKKKSEFLNIVENQIGAKIFLRTRIAFNISERTF